MPASAPTRLRTLLVLATTVAAIAGLTGCGAASSNGAETPPASASPTTSPADTPAAAGGDVAALCAANAAAAQAKAGTVAEDLAAVRAQAAVIRSMMPLEGVAPEVAAGADVFASSLDENVQILTQFAPDALVSDVGLDPRFTQSAALNAVATDPDYQAFIVWTIETCSPDLAGEG